VSYHTMALVLFCEIQVAIFVSLALGLVVGALD
jgi:hypothetical protein